MSVEQKLSARKRRTRAEVQKLVAEFVVSGMRRSEFCHSRQLSFSTLDRHLKKRRWKRMRGPGSSAGRLVPVELAARKSPTQHELSCGLVLPGAVAHGWAEAIKKAFGYDLIVVSREDIVTSLLDPSNLALCRTHLGLPVTVDAGVASQVQQVRDAIAEVVAAWSRPLEGKPLIELRAVRMEEDGGDTAEIFSLADAQAVLARSGRMVIEAPAGRGKTTTLVQLAKRHNGSGGLAPLVDLPGWVQSGKNLLQFISETLPFQSRGLSADVLARLHVQEPFSFLLNGWNEIGESDSLNGASAQGLAERLSFRRHRGRNAHASSASPEGCPSLFG
jgi:hypothetical protein